MTLRRPAKLGFRLQASDFSPERSQAATPEPMMPEARSLKMMPEAKRKTEAKAEVWPKAEAETRNLNRAEGRI